MSTPYWAPYGVFRVVQYELLAEWRLGRAGTMNVFAGPLVPDLTISSPTADQSPLVWQNTNRQAHVILCRGQVIRTGENTSNVIFLVPPAAPHPPPAHSRGCNER